MAPGARSPGSYTREVSSGSYAAARPGELRSAGTTAYVIDTGQPWPASAELHTMKPAARATWTPGRSSAQGAPARPSLIATSIREWYAGWKSTSSTRLP